MRSRSPLCALLLLTVACSESVDDPGASAEDASPAEDATTEDWDFVMESDPFTLAPSEERYYCYTATLEEAALFHSFAIDDYTAVHHMFFARTLAPEPEGVHECDVLFRPTWLPLFTTGNGGTTLDLPEGSAFRLEKDTQLLMQLHLLNTTPETITETVQIRARYLSEEEQTYEAALFPFGATTFELPPMSPSEVVHECVMHKNMDAFIAFPHMHELGTEMVFEASDGDGPLRELYRVSYDFDNQQLDPVQFSLSEGQRTRLTCRYDNTTAERVRYGESTLEEMCFFSLFIRDGESLDGHCVELAGLFGPSGDAGGDAMPDAAAAP